MKNFNQKFYFYGIIIFNILILYGLFKNQSEYWLIIVLPAISIFTYNEYKELGGDYIIGLYGKVKEQTINNRLDFLILCLESSFFSILDVGLLTIFEKNVTDNLSNIIMIICFIAGLIYINTTINKISKLRKCIENEVTAS